jgi:hypothetical protein
MNYCNEVQGFINYVTSNPRNITGGNIMCSFKRCKNKKFLDPDIVTIHLLHKGFMEEYLRWYANGEPFVPRETMVERMIESTSSVNNVHEVVNNNGNSY